MGSSYKRKLILHQATEKKDFFSVTKPRNIRVVDEKITINFCQQRYVQEVGQGW